MPRSTSPASSAVLGLSESNTLICGSQRARTGRALARVAGVMSLVGIFKVANAQTDHFPRVVHHDDAALVLAVEHVAEAVDRIMHMRRVHHDAHGADHPRQAELVARIERQVEELRVEVFRVGNLVAVERQEEPGFDQAFDGVFARLDEVVAAPACEQFGEHFLVGSVVLDRDVDAGLFLERVDDRARDVFRPAEEIERLSGRGRGQQAPPKKKDKCKTREQRNHFRFYFSLQN